MGKCVKLSLRNIFVCDQAHKSCATIIAVVVFTMMTSQFEIQPSATLLSKTFKTCSLLKTEAGMRDEGRHLLRSSLPWRENLHTRSHTRLGVLLPSILPPCLWRAVKAAGLWVFGGVDDPKLLTGAVQRRRS